MNTYDIYKQKGYASLIWASVSGKVSIVEVLLKAGADVHIQNKVRNNKLLE